MILNGSKMSSSRYWQNKDILVAIISFEPTIAFLSDEHDGMASGEMYIFSRYKIA